MPGNKLVLLDFGGVLLKLRAPQEAFGVADDMSTFNERWLRSRAVRALECGQSDIHDFAAAAVSEFDLPYSEREFLERFESWPDKLFDDIEVLLRELRNKHRLALLSNTNPVHWQRPDIQPVLEPLFDELFLSFHTGHLKPDPSAFSDVIARCGIDAADVLFFDDNPINVRAAVASGMQAFTTRGADELAQTCRQLGLLAAGDD